MNTNSTLTFMHFNSSISNPLMSRTAYINPVEIDGFKNQNYKTKEKTI